MGPEGIIIAEGLKFLLMLAFQEAQKAGLTKEQIDQLWIDERTKFLLNDPKKIPEV